MLGFGLAATLGCATVSVPRVPFIPVPIPPPTQPIPALIVALASESPRVRATAAWQLTGATEMHAEAVAALLPLQDDPDKVVRYSAAWALGHLGQVSGVDEPPEATLPPKLVRKRAPDYPDAAFGQRIEGTVLLEILIGEEGEVAHLEVRQSIPALDGAAIKCVAAWTFEPARWKGKPRAQLAHAPVSFKIG